MSAKKTTEVTTTNHSQELALDFMADVGTGMEGADKDSFAIPFLRVLQKISPQVDEADAAYIEGAKGGLLFNSVTQELYPSVTFLPCAYQRRFLRWAPRGSDGGYKGEFMPEAVAAMRDEGELVEFEGRLYFPLEDGSVNPKKCDFMADTRSHFGIVVNEETGAYSQVLLALSSTQIKKSKQLMSLLSAVKVKGPNGMVTPPTWVNKITLTSAVESNDQGSWFGIKLAPAGFITDQDLYAAGREFHAAIAAGDVKAKYDGMNEEQSSDKF